MGGHRVMDNLIALFHPISTESKLTSPLSMSRYFGLDLGLLEGLVSSQPGP